MDTDRANLLIATVGAVLTAGLLWVAVNGLRSTADQIEGATLYQIARDGRQLTSDFRDDKATVGDVLSYFHSVFLLHEREVIDEDGWLPIRRALCYFVRGSEDAITDLEKYADRYDEGFIALTKNIEGASSCA